MTEKPANNFAAIVTFFIVLLLFGGLNLWTLISVPECCDQFDYFGFPISFLERGGIAEVLNFSAPMLVLDVAIALVVSAAAAWFVRQR